MEQKKKEDNNKEKNNKEENTINENIEQKEIEEKVKKNYEFCLATKIGNKPDLMPKFLRSPAFKDIVNFLYNIQNKIKGIKLSDIPPKSNNKCLSNFENLFNSLEELYIKFPPKEGNEKYNIQDMSLIFCVFYMCYIKLIYILKMIFLF